MKNNLLTLISIIGLIAFAAIGYFLQSSLNAPEGTPRATMQADCDLHKTACNAIFPNGKQVTLSLTPKEIPLLKPVKVELDLNGIEATDVKLNIIGLNMDMGINRNSLVSADNKRFTGEIILPICSNQRMEWEAQAVISNGKETKKIIAPFQFYTTK